MTGCAAIFGIGGTDLAADERAFFRAVAPAGFILFARNCQGPEQVRRLTDGLKDLSGDERVPILIDQEGGRVARLKPPHWRAAPPAASFGALAERDLAAAVEAVRLNAALIGRELAALGITVDCLPVLDLRLPTTHAAIGDRAFHADPAIVAALGQAACEGLLSSGVLPVIKHAPGHGRAAVDSHLDLPRVTADLDTLRSSDFRPFAALRDMPWAITAHIVYTAIDAERPGTLSAAVIGQAIRGEIGFDGLLLTDDISMKALRGRLRDLAAGAIGAGCDLALHCNGILSEMAEVAEGAGSISAAAQERLARGWGHLPAPAAAPPAGALTRRLEALLSG